eukprot:gb/GFBE01017003.1/.p1 GENE.gb/GFBE01017003.1/~~gb/GFBE01017003.1/.p1  ORF type:complete len:292 (+),score=56.10 gb/GFBE01017003.1/:1-876(+)
MVLQVGLFFVMIAQIFSPPAVLVWSIYAIDWSNAALGLGNWEYIPGSYEKGVSNLSSHLLGTLFLFIFILNGIYVIRDDSKTAGKIWYMVQKLEKHKRGEKVDRNWLRAGAVINSWCVVISAICMGPCFTLSKSPKDIIFDAFALLFLFRLDDVTGDLGFLDDRWNSDTFGTFYESFRRREMQQNAEWGVPKGFSAPADSSGDETDTEQDTPPDASCIPGCTIYKIAIVILSILLVLMPLSFIFLQGVQPRRETERIEAHETNWQAMQTSMEDMQKQLAALSQEIARVKKP